MRLKYNPENSPKIYTNQRLFWGLPKTIVSFLNKVYDNYINVLYIQKNKKML